MVDRDGEALNRRGRGRPRYENARRMVRGVRFDGDEEAMLEHLEIEFGMNISDIIRKAVRFYYYHMVKKL